MRWLSLAWFLVWFPAYWKTWGVANFAHLCDAAVILTCIGMWCNSALLIASQAVGALIIDAAWVLEACWMLFAGHRLFGGAEYLVDSRYPLWVRLLTLFHLVLPVLLLWGLFRFGYDRRGWALQCAIALPCFVVARFTQPALNINFAFRDPFLHRAWRPAPIYVLVAWLFMAIVIYLPTHAVLARIFPRPQARAS